MNPAPMMMDAIRVGLYWSRLDRMMMASSVAKIPDSVDAMPESFPLVPLGMALPRMSFDVMEQKALAVAKRVSAMMAM